MPNELKISSKNILIIGAGRAGRLLLTDIRQHHPKHTVVGFIDDQAPSAPGAPVLGRVKDIAKVARLYRLDEMVIAIPSADGALVRRILLANLKNRIPIRIVPRDQRIIGQSDVRYREVNDLSYEDFLGKSFRRGNVEKLEAFYRGKTVFITGGAGSIGSEIVRQLLDLKVKKVVVYDHSEYLLFRLEQELREEGLEKRCVLIVGNILHSNKLAALFKRFKPDIVFHAAAYKHVHLMQDNVDEAVYNNVIGTRRVVDAAVTAGIPLFTFISTDKVVNPTSVMGATKKLCEYYIQSLPKGRTRFNIVRFGNVINSNGSALPLFDRQIALYRYVTVTHPKMMRFFMSIREAAQLVIESTAGRKDGSIHILDMGELINIHDVALCLIRSKNLIPEEDVEVRITGLRKGEKMVEELYTKGEKRGLRRTSRGRVYTLRQNRHTPKSITGTLDLLEHSTKTGSQNAVLKHMLKKLFPQIKNL